jgi:hypothetical protein
VASVAVCNGIDKSRNVLKFVSRDGHVNLSITDELITDPKRMTIMIFKAQVTALVRTSRQWKIFYLNILKLNKWIQGYSLQ